MPNSTDGNRKPWDGDGLEHRIRRIAYEPHNWPHTPSPDRLLRARVEVERHMRAGMPMGINLDPEYGTDLKMTDPWYLLEEETRDIYRKWGLEEASKSLREMGTPINTLDVKDVLQDIAAEADTRMTFGIAIFRPDPLGETTHTVAFSRLSRNPDWMGRDAILLKVQGLVALVYESVWESHIPGVVVALALPDPILAHGALTHVPFPEGQAAWLQEVLEFHGALAYWLEDTDSAETTRGQ